MVGKREGTCVSQAAGCNRNTQSQPRTSRRIALRLPAPALAKARQIAGRKGIGYQTLLKMLVHEGLLRESRCQ